MIRRESSSNYSREDRAGRSFLCNDGLRMVVVPMLTGTATICLRVEPIDRPDLADLRLPTAHELPFDLEQVGTA